MLLEAGADIHRESARASRTTLMAPYRYPSMLRLLLERGAKVNEQSPGGTTALMTAARNGRVESVTVLLDAGADPTISNRGQKTALDMAEAAGHSETARILSESIAKWDNQQIDPAADLQSAAQRGHLPTLRALLAGGADPNEPDARGATPIVLVRDAQVIHALVEAGADPNAALLGAVRSGEADAVTALLESGASPDGDGERFTPLYYAVSGGYVDTVRALIIHGAQLRCTEDDASCLGTVAYGKPRDEKTGKPAQLEIARMLLDAGANVREKNSSGMSALTKVAGKGNIELVQLLLDHEANPDDGLRLAAESGGPEVLRLLLDAGANANARSYLADTALHGAARCRGEFDPASTFPHARACCAAVAAARQLRGGSPEA